ncbi:hypothetical protein SASPL_146479 [Salvia splendens]|uniref:Uncharacterized protein n=1 Tax=Salvia splendens TaxID=180675 RepID=A0A8X8WBZ4_SALSN|nr:hypothetical protein SASPL_146479 [Salvia splendens]
MGHQEYSSEFKNQVVQFIIGRCIGIVPPRDTLKEAQLKFKISRQTCTRWWNAAKKQQQRGESMQLVSLKKVRSYPKKLHLDVEVLKSMHFSKRCNLLSVAAGLGCSKATVWRTNQLPMDLEVPVELAMQAIAYLRDQGSNHGLEMIAHLGDDISPYKFFIRHYWAVSHLIDVVALTTSKTSGRGCAAFTARYASSRGGAAFTANYATGRGSGVVDTTRKASGQGRGTYASGGFADIYGGNCSKYDLSLGNSPRYDLFSGKRTKSALYRASAGTRVRRGLIHPSPSG